MNVARLKEQVFELIEREAVDPKGVHEALEMLPECRAYFDELKAARELAHQLPWEDPPSSLDAAILRSAGPPTR